MKTLLNTLSALVLSTATLHALACQDGSPAAPASGSTKPKEPPKHYVPLEHSAPLLDGADPVKEFLAFAEDAFQQADSGLEGKPVGRNPRELLAFTAKAEREGDWKCFAAALDVQDPARLSWAAAVLATPLRRNVNLEFMHCAEALFGKESIPARNARLVVEQQPSVLSQCIPSYAPTPGFYLPNGSLMMAIRETPAGWRVTGQTWDELEVQPANNLPGMIADLAFFESLVAQCRAEKDQSDFQAMLLKATTVSEQVQQRAREHYSKQGLLACPECGSPLQADGTCSLCSLFD